MTERCQLWLAVKGYIYEKHDVLMVMGGSAVYCGDIGAGNTTKLANQVIVPLILLLEGMMLLAEPVLTESRFQAIKGSPLNW